MRSPLARRGASFALLLICVLLGPLAATAGDDDFVFFNAKSLKYHCMRCEWAIKCTANCVK